MEEQLRLNGWIDPNLPRVHVRTPFGLMIVDPQSEDDEFIETFKLLVDKLSADAFFEPISKAFLPANCSTDGANWCRLGISCSG